MIGRLSVARRVFVLALSLVALYRIQLIFMIMGLDQVIVGLAQADGITIAISLLSALVVTFPFGYRRCRAEF